MNQKSRQRTGPEVQTNDPVFIVFTVDIVKTVIMVNIV